MVTTKETYHTKITLMREAGRILRSILHLLMEHVKPGITTGELDRIAMEQFNRYNVEPAFLGYRGFPKSICTSLNEEVVHGIPGDRELEDGDILSIDIGLCRRGYYADMASTIPVGRISSKAEEIISVGKRTLAAAVDILYPGIPLRKLSAGIQRYAEDHGYNVLRQYVGHEIGKKMHEELQIPNFVSPGYPSPDIRLEPGTVIAIEPMLTEGTYDVTIADDGWTVSTADRKLSVHFEHTIAITDDSIDVLTEI